MQTKTVTNRVIYLPGFQKTFITKHWPVQRFEGIYLS